MDKRAMTLGRNTKLTIGLGVAITALSLAGCGTVGQFGGQVGTRLGAGNGAGSAAKQESGWIRYPDAPSARFAAAGATSGFRLLVVGGSDDSASRLNSVEQFTAFDKWETLPALPTRRSEPCAATVPAERILVFGGAVPGSGATTPSGTVERLSLLTRKWDRLAEMPTPRWGAGAAAKGLMVYVAGGNSVGGHPVAAFEKYDAINNSWEKLPSFPTRRVGAAVASLGERVVVAGGSNFFYFLGDLQIYNPEARTWTQGAPMPTPRANAGYAIYGHRMYVVGGQSAAGKSRAVESFDLGTGTWTSHTPLPEALSSLVAARLGERLVVTGGLDQSGKASAKTWGLPFSL